MKLLDDILVLDFSQFLSGPSAGLRLADFGAEVIKIERPGIGDICRQLYVSDVMIEGESTIFHAINRNKKSYAADLKNPVDLEKVKQLIKKADVMMHNFRPGVMERIGIDYETVKALNPSIVYAEISGYGNEGPWRDLPGQDLLVQSVAGLTWLSNNKGTPPTPMGVAVVDILAGTQAAQGILAALYQRAVSGEGALVQVSMLEAILDFQFEVLTCFYNDGNELPERSKLSNGNPYIAAPYGIYETASGYLALSMGNVPLLGRLTGCDELLKYTDPADWYDKRDEIKSILSAELLRQSAEYWLSVLIPADVWCAKVLDYDQLRKEESYRELNMEIKVKTVNGITVTTTRCPIRVDGELLVSSAGAPLLGEHNREIEERFGLTV